MPAIMQVEDWNDFQAFLAIAQEGQLLRAAKRLGVDATTVGRRLRRLEARLGQTLFEQSRDGQVLTDVGEDLMSKIEPMAAAAAQVSSADRHSDGPVGKLRISVSEGFGTWFLAPRLPSFNRQHPGVSVDLVASTNYLNLSRREADLGIFLSRPRVGLLVAKKLATYSLNLYATHDYLVANGYPKNIEDLSDHRLVGYIPDLLQADELRYAEEVYKNSVARLRSSSINAQFAMIVGGGGIGVLPSFIGDIMPQLRRVLVDRTLKRNFWLVTHKDTQQSAKVRAFDVWLRKVLDEGGLHLLLGTAESMNRNSPPK